MRPMPPNATQMTSMITMQQPVHATTAATTTTTATTTTPATVTTSAGPVAGKQPTASSLKQQQQIAGQRTALKLSSRPPAHAQQADQQQQQQQQQQQWHQPPPTRQPPVRQQSSGYAHESPSLITSTVTSGVGVPADPQHRLQQQHCPSSVALECSAISGLTTTTTSQATGAHERSDLDPADDDPSECSCSNSFECSLDELTHSTSSHLEEPLLGAGGGGPVSSQAQQPMMNHYTRSGHVQHQHRQSVQHQQHHRNHNNNNNNHHHHHHHQDIYNHHHRQQHQPQNFQLQHPPGQQYLKSHDLGHHPSHQQHRYHPSPAPLPPPISLYGGHTNQIQQPPPPSLPLSANNHLQQQRHRPLVPHASMPPSLSSVPRAYLAQSPPPPPPPAPLVRHSTYAATSDTITDDSLHHHHHQHHHQGFMPAVNGPTVSPPLSPSAGGPQHHGASYLYNAGSNTNSTNPNTFNEAEMLIGKRNGQQPKRETLNFRRSATTREDDGNRWHRNAQQQHQQDHQQPYNYNDTMAARTLPLERHQSGAGSTSLQRSKHQRSTPRLANGHPNQPTSANQKVAQRRHQQDTGNVQYQDNSQQQQHSPNPPPPPILSGERAQSALMSSGGDPGQTNAVGGLHGGGGVGGVGNLLLGANSSLPHSVSPFEAAATFCPPILAPSASLPPIGPLTITSHRTNSPWMRLSSIILTPVGIVIVLFIVVSPLLHYLM